MSSYIKVKSKGLLNVLYNIFPKINSNYKLICCNEFSFKSSKLEMIFEFIFYLKLKLSFSMFEGFYYICQR